MKNIIESQREFDRQHGWLPDKTDPESIFEFLKTDAIGLAGEVGEVAGILKNLGLELNHDGENLEESMNEAIPRLREELIDVFIYLIRMLDYLDTDIESEYAKKRAINKVKFKNYENI